MKLSERAYNNEALVFADGRVAVWTAAGGGGGLITQAVRSGGRVLAELGEQCTLRDLSSRYLFVFGLPLPCSRRRWPLRSSRQRASIIREQGSPSTEGTPAPTAKRVTPVAASPARRAHAPLATTARKRRASR